MVLDIPAVPDKLSRSRYIEMVRSLGFDPSEVRRLEFRINGVYAEVKARTPNSAEQVALSLDSGDADEPARHVIFIPIDGDS